jgi:predicted permease
MDLMRILLSRCVALLWRQKLDDDLDDELRSHIEFAVEENVKRGMSQDAARTAALHTLGGVTQTKETYRLQRGIPWLGQIVRDVRFGIRQLRRSLMARSAARERELATRLAMGASRRRLIQQLMVESLLIAVLGTAAGMIAAPLVSRSLAAVLLGDDPTTFLDTTLDWRVFAFVTLAAVVSTVLIGLIPALRATSKNLNEQFKSGSHTTSASERRRLLPRILMSIEVSLALILVVGAGLLGTSLVKLYRTGLGFDPKNVVELGLDMGKQPLDGDALFQWYAAYGDALRRLPGVKSVSFGAEIPFDGSIWTAAYHTPSSGGDRVIYMSDVAPAFFQTMSIPLLSGRDFKWNDNPASGRKVILNQTAARYLFPDRNPIGQHVIGSENATTYEVIGVVGDIHYASIREAAPAGGFAPIMQYEAKRPSFAAVIRIEGSPVPLAAAARALAAKMAPEIPAPALTTMSSELDASISSERMMAMLAVFFAGCALLVMTIGLYGTLAYSAARRTSEIGIRMALGAQRAQVIALVFRENAWIAASGSLAGLLVALFASRALASFLYGTSTRDPWVLVGSVGALVVIASAASLVPALRAARTDPMRALRTE